MNTAAKSFALRRALQLYANPANLVHQRMINKPKLDVQGCPMNFKAPPSPRAGTVVLPKPDYKPGLDLCPSNIAPNWTPAPLNAYPKRLDLFRPAGV